MRGWHRGTECIFELKKRSMNFGRSQPTRPKAVELVPQPEKTSAVSLLFFSVCVGCSMLFSHAFRALLRWPRTTTHKMVSTTTTPTALQPRPPPSQQSSARSSQAMSVSPTSPTRSTGGVSARVSTSLPWSSVSTLDPASPPSRLLNHLSARQASPAWANPHSLTLSSTPLSILAKNPSLHPQKGPKPSPLRASVPVRLFSPCSTWSLRCCSV
jgi:hypothetical protein